MIWISEKQLYDMHSKMVAETGGLNAVRDKGLVQSALASPFQAFGGISLYPTMLEKAVRLGFCLSKNHPFVDGNKRIGVHAMLVVLSLNGIKLDYTQEQLVEISLALASGNIDYDKFLAWVKDKAR